MVKGKSHEVKPAQGKTPGNDEISTSGNVCVQRNDSNN